MVNTESIERFFETLPAMSARVKAALLVTMRRESSAKRASAKLLQRGFLGSIPFAHTKDTEIILVARPGIPIGQMPVVLTWPDIPDGITIAPSIHQFVAGRLAFVDIAGPSVDLSSDLIAELVELSAAFGDSFTTETLLAGVPKVRQIEDERLRRGALWGTIADRDPLFEALQGAWTHEQEAVGPWLDGLRADIRQHKIIRNIAVCHYKSFGMHGASEEAWRIVHDECVLDMTYSGAIPGPSLGSRAADALRFAVAYLREYPLDSEPVHSKAWELAQAADKRGYDGSEHLIAAREVLTSDPYTAFTFLVNAVYFSARTNRKIIFAAFDQACELARLNGWEILGSVLKRDGLENRDL